MKIGMIVFPGSNCDKDIGTFFSYFYQISVKYIWYQDDFDWNEKFDLIILPGGFSFGDYLRAGAIASSSNIIRSLKQYIKKGGKVLGICNGFQILTESKLLEGSLIKNESLKYICKNIDLKIGNSPMFQKSNKKKFTFPAANSDGNYYASLNTIKKLEDNHQIIFYYEKNVNGSVNQIAGISSKDGKIIGIMPHPERSLSYLQKKQDGKEFFDLILK